MTKVHTADANFGDYSTPKNNCLTNQTNAFYCKHSMKIKNQSITKITEKLITAWCFKVYLVEWSFRRDENDEDLFRQKKQ